MQADCMVGARFGFVYWDIKKISTFENCFKGFVIKNSFVSNASHNTRSRSRTSIGLAHHHGENNTVNVGLR